MINRYNTGTSAVGASPAQAAILAALKCASRGVIGFSGTRRRHDGFRAEFDPVT